MCGIAAHIKFTSRPENVHRSDLKLSERLTYLGIMGTSLGPPSETPSTPRKNEIVESLKGAFRRSPWRFLDGMRQRKCHPVLTCHSCMEKQAILYISRFFFFSKQLLDAYRWNARCYTEKTSIPFPFKLNGIWSWWHLSFRFWTKWKSIWFKIERKTVITIISHSIWKEMEI